MHKMGHEETPTYYQTINKVAERIETKKISPVELTKVLFDRIKKIDNQLHSYVNLMEESALEAARTAEQEIMSGVYRSSLHGIPVGVKDVMDVKGYPTLSGMKALEGNVADQDAAVVTRLKDAGAIILGKHATTGGCIAGYHPEFKIPKNPWDRRRWAGMSSSGSGVATAAGLCFASLAADSGGSIRWPSASCGVVGIKPTWGLVSVERALRLGLTLGSVGPMTRSVRDTAILLATILDNKLRGSALLSDIGKPINGVRIGFDETYATRNVEQEVADTTKQAVAILESAGAVIVPVNMPLFDELLEMWHIILWSETVQKFSGIEKDRYDQIRLYLRDKIEMARTITLKEYVQANQLRHQYMARLEEALENVDVLACPAMSTLPHKVNDRILHGLNPLPSDFNSVTKMQFLVPFNCSGDPTLTLPCGFSRDSLPMGLQLVGKRYSEPLLFRVGYAYESATEWHRMHPNV
ncbi:MAG: Asp-tRNA(Asn)/Glu-tRNA(Gln) amidotransferase GatCAB subunit A [candidate division Zixibacteria bacterium]|nr:Asp-tRNA(Asn)/Glu-tRNA(Gln) amidotransferase GatCAB subunit A [candidate division Zixibacteria bacterium]